MVLKYSVDQIVVCHIFTEFWVSTTLQDTFIINICSAYATALSNGSCSKALRVSMSDLTSPWVFNAARREPTGAHTMQFKTQGSHETTHQAAQVNVRVVHVLCEKEQIGSRPSSHYWVKNGFFVNITSRWHHTDINKHKFFIDYS